MLRIFFTVVEAVALPVNIVPPTLFPVPWVEDATMKSGSRGADSVVVALMSSTGRVSFSVGSVPPLTMSSKSVLSVSDSSGATSPETVEEHEVVQGSGSVVVEGVLVDEGGVSGVGGVVVAACGELVEAVVSGVGVAACPELVEGVLVEVVVSGGVVADSVVDVAVGFSGAGI